MPQKFALGFEYILIRQFLSQIIIMTDSTISTINNIMVFSIPANSQKIEFDQINFCSLEYCFLRNIILIMIKIQKYLPEEYTVELKLKSFFVGSIKKSNTSQALQKIKAIETLNKDEASHLKRIRKKKQESDQTDILLCPEDQLQVKQQIVASFGQMLTKMWTEEVPFSNPCSKQQFSQWSKIWPINFIQQEIYKQIKHSKQETQYLQSILSKKQKNIIIFDEKQQTLLVKQVLHYCREGTIQHQIMQILQEWPHTKQFEQLPNAYYLTKLRVFCSIPICQMCAMALVHSRLERIYFPQALDIRKISEIMCCSKLNHRIKIFQLCENP